MHTFVIDRRQWLHGEGHNRSKLLRPEDGKMCCLGMYCEQVLGLPKAMLADKADPEDLNGTEDDLEDALGWLLDVDDKLKLSETAFRLVDVNDKETGPPSIREITSEPVREQKLAELFAQHDVQVTFIN